MKSIYHHSSFYFLSINSIDLINLIKLLGVPLCSALAVLGPIYLGIQRSVAAGLATTSWSHQHHAMA
jgi:hypothetical protein